MVRIISDTSTLYSTQQAREAVLALTDQEIRELLA